MYDYEVGSRDIDHYRVVFEATGTICLGDSCREIIESGLKLKYCPDCRIKEIRRLGYKHEQVHAVVRRNVHA